MGREQSNRGLDRLREAQGRRWIRVAEVKRQTGEVRLEELALDDRSHFLPCARFGDELADPV
jgi:hypothetical protein